MTPSRCVLSRQRPTRGQGGTCTCQVARLILVCGTVVQEARDQDEPEETIIALIVHANQAKVEAAAREAATQRAVKAELQQMNIPDLRERAAAAGASADAIEDARDGEDPKAELIALILARQDPLSDKGSQRLKSAP